MAAPVGHSVVMLHISRMNISPRICLGGSERIIQVNFNFMILFSLLT